jgi:lysophospholipase L1-like esterase
MTQPKPETATEILNRSAFGFALLAFIPALITAIWLWVAPPSPADLFRQLQVVIQVGFSIVAIALLWLMVHLYRLPSSAIDTRPLVMLLERQFVAIALVLLLLEANVLASFVLTDIAPSLTHPARFLLACWSLVVLGILALTHRERLAPWFTRTRALWVSIGVTITSGVVLAAVIALNGALVQVSGLNDALRGGLDYRELDFYDDGQAMPAASDFWQEQAQVRVRWSPYTYWMMDEMRGDYVNISADGIRAGYNAPTDDDPAQIAVFGGSTVWGEGARDSYTIPSHISRVLADADHAVQVTNYGQTGYVSTQDLILFQLQLAQGRAPDVAIFYQGFNDTLSAWAQGVTGVSLQENMRLNDAEAGRRLRAGQPVLRLPAFQLTDNDLSRAAVTPTRADTIAERWFANVEQAHALATAYDVDVVFVWQPAIIHKALTEREEAIYQRWDNQRPGLFDLYADVDRLVRQAARYDILILSDLFATNQDTLFHDLVHITEIGNMLVAEAIVPSIQTHLNEQ